jgi:hypothetical protein
MSISPDELVVALVASDGTRELAHVGHEGLHLDLGHTRTATGIAADLAIPHEQPDALDLRRMALGAAAGSIAYAVMALGALLIPPTVRGGLGLVAIVAALVVAGRVARPRTPRQWVMTCLLLVAATVALMTALVALRA